MEYYEQVFIYNSAAFILEMVLSSNPIFLDCELNLSFPLVEA
jgi:hypothetical protein